MPTISEPLWPENNEKINRVVADFIAGVDSADVFKARLFGCNLRGEDLTSVFNVAMEAVIGRQMAFNAKFEPTKVLVMERGGETNTIRFKDAASAGQAVALLRKQPNVLFACRVVN